jgi:hypothetical protein
LTKYNTLFAWVREAFGRSYATAKVKSQ